MTDLLRRMALPLLAVLTGAFTAAGAAAADPANKFNLHKGDRVVFVGGTFAEREALFGYIETMLQTRFPDLALTFRNLGYSADTAAVLTADNASDRIDDGNRATNRALNFGTMHKHLADAKADVILLCLGMADSFDGEAGLADFRKHLQSVIKAYSAKMYNGKSNPRLVLIGPIAHERLPGVFADSTEHNKQLQAYNEALRQVATEHKLPFVDLFAPMKDLMEKNDGDPFTINGIHLSAYGYWAAAEVMARHLGVPTETTVRLDSQGRATLDLRLGLVSPELPSPHPPEQTRAHSKLPVMKLFVQNLPAGKYTVKSKDREYGTSSADGWAKGVWLWSSPLHEAAERLRLAIVDRNQQFFYKWRAVNGEYIYGRRAAPFGVVNFPGEMKQLDQMCAERDAVILKMNQPAIVGSFDIAPTVEKPEKPTTARKEPPAKPDQETAKRYNQKQGYMPNGQLIPTAADPEEERKTFKLPGGYEINLFASEKDFPLHNPLAMAWDTKGRLWVTTMPSYPQYLPGQPADDKLLILEDTKGTGKADRCTVFADKLYLPTGLEFGNGGVYVSQQPNLMFIKNDGDVAGKREVILHGFGTGDSHHAMHTLQWSPEGALHFQEGIFHRSNVETPWGVVRQHDAGIYRFQPRRHKLEVYVSYNFANPWGHVFDRWGQNFIADASGGANYFGLPLTGHVPYPGQHPGMKVFTSVVRPTCGCEIVSSRHFPPEVQGNFLVPNNIGFQGIKQHKIIEEGSGFTSKELEPLLFSTDRNFRPVDLKFGPDGALYVVDWFNPLIGHMQHSIRDPGRDHYHGRIWRITYKGRDLVKAPKIAGEPIPVLLDLLKSYEDRTRYRVRMELRERKRDDVVAAVQKWMRDLDPKDALFEHNLLEALWVIRGTGIPSVAASNVISRLLEHLMDAKDYHARAAVTRTLRDMREEFPLVDELLSMPIDDEHPRVRLEAVVGLSYFPNARAAEFTLQALKRPTDYYLDYGIKETMATLQPYWKAAIAAGQPFKIDSPAAANFVLGSVTTTELVKMARSPAVYMAFLTRQDVPPQYRKEALEGLAKLNKTNVLTELFAAVERIDQSDDAHAGHVLTDLAHMLTDRKAADLAKVRPRLEQLAIKARRPITRQVAYVTLATADNSVDRVWQLASKSADTLRDVVEAVPLLPDAKLRAATYPLVKPLLTGLPEPLASQVKAHKSSRGRMVRIELPGNARTLTLAEVQVFSDGVNVALRGKARQSSTAFDGAAERGIDGNTSGVYGAGGQTHTMENAKNPWWEVDLGREFPIEAVAIWNRTDGTLGSRLQGFKLSVLDSSRKEVFAKVNNPAPAVSARFALEGDPTGSVRRAAVAALPSIPGHEAEAFTTLAKFYRDGEMRDTVVRALRRIPRSQWPKDQVRPLIDAITGHVAKLSTEQRTEPDALDALQLGNNLAGALPQAEAKAVRGKLGDLGVNVILLRTVPHKMAYDRTKVYAEAGKPLVIVLENADIMPHNLVLGQPGSMTELGMAADLLGTNPNAFAMNFIPKSPKVLQATPQLQPRETARLQFIAPKLPGEYPYVCTFPGHWRVMYGTLHVVPRLADVPEDELNPPIMAEGEVRPFVHNWTIEDLLGDLKKIDHGRSFQRGKAMFSAATCIQCHKIGKEGGVVGPDLNDLAKKLADKKFTRADILREIIEPSKVIDEKYQTHVIVTTKGEVVQGVILSKDAKKLQVVTNPLAKPLEIAADDVESDQVTKVSMMPQGLLVTLNKEEILDLMAYLIFGANPDHSAFSNREPLPGRPQGQHRHEH